jgi:hypothetical protein
MPALGSALGTSQLYVFTRTRFLVIPVPSISLACSNRSLSKSKRTCFLRIQPRRRSAQHLPDGSLYSVSLYPIFVRAAMFPPMVYGLWTVVHGAATGWYPYPFVDMRSVGYQEGLMNMAGFLAVFISVQLTLIVIDRLIGSVRWSRR